MLTTKCSLRGQRTKTGAQAMARAGVVLLLSHLGFAQQSLASNDPYDDLYDAIMTRHGPDGKTYGKNEIAPLIFADSDFPFDDKSYPQFKAALDALIALPQETIRRYSNVKRAMLQRHLWKVFDLTTAKRFSKSAPSDSRTRIESRRIDSQRRLATLIRALGLTKAEIEALPNAAVATANSGKYPKHHDPERPFQPFFPTDLFTKASQWVCLGKTDDATIPAPAHTHRVQSRSTFLTYMRLPGGRTQTSAFLTQLNRDTVFPAGTQFALVEQALLISDKGELVLSPLILNVQLRTHPQVGLDPKNSLPEKEIPCVAEFALQPRQLIMGNAVMRAIVEKENRFKSLCLTSDPFQHARGRIVLNRLQRCVNCHYRPGLYSLRSHYSNSKFMEVDPADIGRKTAVKKRHHETWKSLQNHWKESNNSSDDQSNASSAAFPEGEAVYRSGSLRSRNRSFDHRSESVTTQPGFHKQLRQSELTRRLSTLQRPAIPLDHNPQISSAKPGQQPERAP